MNIKFKHHPWCYYRGRNKPEYCMWCKEFYKKYPVTRETLGKRALAEKYFPEVIQNGNSS